MFGYICPKICDLKVCEYEEYKRYYCGLCKVLQRRYSRYSALFLSNDCVFIYLLLSALSESEAKYEKNRCPFHGDRRSRYIAIDDYADYAAAISVMLAYWKTDDDVRDSGKFKSRFARFMLRSAMKKARLRYAEAEKAMADMIRGISELEDRKCSDIDEVSHAFACMFGKILEFSGVTDWEDLYEFGYDIGKYVYLMDAVDDLEKDRASGEYNVLAEKYGDNREEAIKSADFNIFMSLAGAKNVFERFSTDKNKGILLNIITLGLSERAVEVLEGKKSESV